ncbi:DUF1853 family protein [Pseudoduganella aquatica]|uniref:DUF1853 family protein n=1 Tax=Pseudoduganella aquatica TaxID=2660641 RepID=UPI001E4CDC1F|nr:DUF1853 family protein [Pseudoduganella aquatica]
MPAGPDALAGAGIFSRAAGAETYQERFERTWGHLTRPHVRALAWLLEAPDLLDPDSPHWQGRIATLGPAAQAAAGWLAALERDPAPLEAALGSRFYSRLGLYAEKLMAFYFEQQGTLVAHGLQVRANRNDTVGEFDFLLRHGSELLHWEFATKFYLLDDTAGAASFNHLVGPNLADTLGVKMRKTFAKQLELAYHPAAQPLLPQPVDRAQALVKGWLFYPQGSPHAVAGISPAHCLGYWSTLSEFAAGRDGAAQPDQQYVVMPRLQWLAPLKVRAATATPATPATPAAAPAAGPARINSIAAVDSAAPLDAAQVAQAVLARFEQEMSPVMVASVVERDGWLVERERGFVAPDDWRARAAARREQGLLPP